jgi:hypothetical protein
MKNFILFLVMTLSLVREGYSQQQRQQHLADSVMSVRALNDINQLFTLSREQQAALYQVGLTVNQAKRSVFLNFRKTDSFQMKLAAVSFLKDSLYRSVLGADNFKVYRDSSMRRGRE